MRLTLFGSVRSLQRWRVLLAACAAPSLLVLLAALSPALLPESPRFVAVSGPEVWLSPSAPLPPRPPRAVVRRSPCEYGRGAGAPWPRGRVPAHAHMRTRTRTRVTAAAALYARARRARGWRSACCTARRGATA